MAVVFGRNEIGIERTGVRVTVASNDTAKLMYYLSCVCNTIECNQDEDIRRFTDYRNWTRLSNEEQKLLVILCYTFSPDVFDDKVFFRSDALCGDLGNQFYTINHSRSVTSGKQDHDLQDVVDARLLSRAHEATSTKTSSRTNTSTVAAATTTTISTTTCKVSADGEQRLLLYHSIITSCLLFSFSTLTLQYM
jgi:hypothetical protein